MLAQAAALFLTVAALGGAILARAHARRRPVPFALGLGHAAIAVAGLGLLVAAVMRVSQPLAVNASLLLFAIALVGGAFLLLFRLQRENPPGFMIALHGATAIAALVVLWVGALSLA